MRSSLLALSLLTAAAACSGGNRAATVTPAATATPTPTPTPQTDPTPASAAPPRLADTASFSAVGLDDHALDRSVDPCDDFYRFACGGWIDSAPLPDDKPSFTRAFDTIDDANLDYLRRLLDTAASSKPAASSDPARAALGSFYGSCMDAATIDKRGLAPIKPLLALASRVHDGKTLTAAAIELHKHGITALWRFGSTSDLADVTQVIAGIAQGGLGLPDRDFYLRTDDTSTALLAAYEQHVAAMLGFTGMTPADASKAAHDVVALETAIARVSKTSVELRDPRGTYHRVERAGLVEAAPHLDWTAYLRGLGVPDVQAITASSVEFLTGLDGLVVTTPPATWRAYLSFHIVEDTAELLGAGPLAARFAFVSTLTGQKQDEPRWKRCVRATDAALGQLLGQSFVADRFGGDSRAQAEAMVRAIADAMGKNLGALSWMDDATRARALEKLHAMVYQIGYPDAWRAYDWKVKPRAFAENALAGRWFEIRRDLRKIGKPLDKRDWGMTPPTVNAYYDPQYNTMVFPAGILQPPFFDAKAAVAVNLGGIGMVMGHELTHGFDDQGAQFDAAGNLANWWTPAVGTRFAARTQCVVDQYTRYEAVPGTHVNGALTNGENIADIGGLKLAFAAYRTLRAGAKDPQIAGGFDEDQLFFLGFAQGWCTKAHPEYTRMLAQSNEHSPEQWRVNGTLSDTPEFAAAFRCKAGAKMHPANACTVW
jgi:putative endopeptidase